MWPLHGSGSLQNWDTSDKIMKKDLFLFLYVHVCPCECGFLWRSEGAFDPLELEEWVIVNHSTWMLHIEVQFSASTHMHWAFSLLPWEQLSVLFSFTVTVAHLLASNRYKYVNVKKAFKYVQFLAN